MHFDIILSDIDEQLEQCKKKLLIKQKGQIIFEVTP